MQGSTYQGTDHVCISSGTFGSTCSADSDCTDTGTICSTLGDNKKVCLQDKGGKCANNNDCANYLFCLLDGTCGCDVGSLKMFILEIFYLFIIKILN